MTQTDVDRRLIRRLCRRDRARQFISRLCTREFASVRVTTPEGDELLAVGPLSEPDSGPADWVSRELLRDTRLLAEVHATSKDGSGAGSIAGIVVSWLEDLLLLEQEINSLTEEVVHSYEELHLLYSLGGELGEIMELEAACALIVRAVLAPLNALQATLYLTSGQSENAVAHATNPNPGTAINPRARAEATLQVNAAPIGRLVVEGKLERQEFNSGDMKLLDGVAAVAAPAIRNAQLYETARRQADTDGLTGIANHRRLHEQIDEEVALARNKGTTLSIILADLDNFKLFNDLYGHPVGDRVLRAITECLRANVRARDAVGRYGGDEFLVILPETDSAGAMEVARRILKDVASRTIVARGEKLPLSISLGIACYPSDASNKHELIAHADTALYESKNSGGHTVREALAAAPRSDWLTLQGSTFGVLEGLVQAVDAKDHYTREHSEAVTDATLLLARRLNLSEETHRALRIAGLLHDVGKIGIPDRVLKKPGRLTDEEYEIMKQHVQLSEMIIKDVPYLNDVLDAVAHHHEWYDGRGYPYGKSAHDIPLLGRIMAIADAYTAMCLDRPYRKGMNWHEVRAELERGAGTQFDPELVRIFIEAIEEMQGQHASQRAYDHSP